MKSFSKNIPGLPTMTLRPKNFDRIPDTMDGLPFGDKVNLKSIQKAGFTTMEQVLSVQQRLLSDYNRALVASGYGLARSKIKKLDLIDIRGIVEYDQSHSEIDEDSRQPLIDTSKYDLLYLAEHYWYCYVPCFQEGALHVNKNRYMYWKIEEIDQSKSLMTVTVHDHIVQHGLWQPGVRATFTYAFGMYDKPVEPRLDKGFLFPHLLKYEYTPFSEIYRQIPYGQLHWSKADITLWEDVIIHHAKNTEDFLRENRDTDNALEMSKMFPMLILLANQTLQQHKPSRPVKPKADPGTPKKKAKAELDENAVKSPPERVYRTVGPIRMQSQKPPKAPTERSIIKYKTAVWKARGGVRHMADGRVIPFKESVRRRKCLLPESELNKIQTPATTVKIKPGKTNKKDKKDG